MPTVDYTYTFDSTAQGFSVIAADPGVFYPSGIDVFYNGDGSPSPGCLSMGKTNAVAATDVFATFQTPAGLTFQNFGVPAGAVVTGIQVLGWQGRNNGIGSSSAAVLYAIIGSGAAQGVDVAPLAVRIAWGALPVGGVLAVANQPVYQTMQFQLVMQAHSFAFQQSTILIDSIHVQFTYTTSTVTPTTLQVGGAIVVQDKGQIPVCYVARGDVPQIAVIAEKVTGMQISGMQYRTRCDAPNRAHRRRLTRVLILGSGSIVSGNIMVTPDLNTARTVTFDALSSIPDTNQTYLTEDVLFIVETGIDTMGRIFDVAMNLAGSTVKIQEVLFEYAALED